VRLVGYLESKHWKFEADDLQVTILLLYWCLGSEMMFPLKLSKISNVSGVIETLLFIIVIRYTEVSFPE
jgi:hypothetical protein